MDDDGVVNVFYRAEAISRTEPSTAWWCTVTSSYFDAREVQRPKNNANVQSALALQLQVSQALLILYKYTLTVYTLYVCMCVNERAGFQAYHQQTDVFTSDFLDHGPTAMRA